MHIYAYGSVCRGEVQLGSDIDLLAVVDGPAARFDPVDYSVYPYGRIMELWAEGNPFAWHLFMESRLLFAQDGIDFVRTLGQPERYARWHKDSEKFCQLYLAAIDVLAVRRDTTVFELATIFLSIRNLAICYSLRTGASPVFSRRAFEELGADSLNLDPRTCKILEDSRILSTRGFGTRPSEDDVAHVLLHRAGIDGWVGALTAGAIGRE
jgi:hypothetical protein